jgi:hypothetical protein
LRMGIWSSSLMRALVLIAGVILVLQAVHVLSISVAFHAIAQDFKNTRSIAGMAVGIGVSLLAVVPGRKNKGVERRRIVSSCGIERASLWRNAEHLKVIAASLARHSDIR